MNRRGRRRNTHCSRCGKRLTVKNRYRGRCRRCDTLIKENGQRAKHGPRPLRKKAHLYRIRHPVEIPDRAPLVKDAGRILPSISRKTGVARDSVYPILRVFLYELRTAIEKGDTVALRNFGRFYSTIYRRRATVRWRRIPDRSRGKDWDHLRHARVVPIEPRVCIQTMGRVNFRPARLFKLYLNQPQNRRKP